MPAFAGMTNLFLLLNQLLQVTSARGKAKQTLTAPNANNPHACKITPVDYAKRWMDKLPEKGLIEFRHYASHIGMIGEGLDSL